MNKNISKNKPTKETFFFLTDGLEDKTMASKKLSNCSEQIFSLCHFSLQRNSILGQLYTGKNVHGNLNVCALLKNK